MKKWTFFADRGGTFTDIVAVSPNNQITIQKLLSENPGHYDDAIVQGIRNILGISPSEPLPSAQIQTIQIGTTLATNALLERKGDRTVLVITQGFRDALKIAYQNRPDIFALEIVRPDLLYEQVIEAEERYSAQGEELIPVNMERLQQDLEQVYNAGIRSCAIVLMHSYRYPDHEQQVARLAQTIGFTQVSVSHQVSPLIKLISRGDTTVVDAYLSPVLRRYIDHISSTLSTPQLTQQLDQQFAPQLTPQSTPQLTPQLTPQSIPQSTSQLAQQPAPKSTPQLTRFNSPEPVNLMFMQSNGGLTNSHTFQGKDSILSGPAGGVVGAVKTGERAGFQKIIGFDMGGTSTDVSHYCGEYERTLETEIAGVYLRTPMLAIHTVAAGGGSILQFDGSRYRVGPQSAGANPGPACYGKGGPLTITDCNVMVGKLQPEFFPKVFGETADLPLDRAIVEQKFAQLTQTIADGRQPEQVAEGFLEIAVEKMTTAIKKISLQRGYDVSEYTLCCFGGAGGQHACLIAESLGMKQILIHPYAGVLSAYGIGLAETRILREQSIEAQLSPESLTELEPLFTNLRLQAQAELNYQFFHTNSDPHPSLEIEQRVYLKYAGTDFSLLVKWGTAAEMKQAFETLHQQRYGFIFPDNTLLIEAISLELIAPGYSLEESAIVRKTDTIPHPEQFVSLYTTGQWHNAPVFQRETLQPQDTIPGPALIVEATGTNVIEPGWEATVSDRNDLILSHVISSYSKGQNSNLQVPDWSGDEGKSSAYLDSFPPVQITPLESAQDSSNHNLKNCDPVKLEIFNNLFRSIAEQMGTTLQNTSYSVNIKERLDFSCALFDRQGQLVANAPHIPVHLGSMGESVCSLMAAKRNQMYPGQVYASNNPYNGGTHLPDITVITPIFITPKHPEFEQLKRDFSDDSGARLEPIFYVASRGHHADIGGITPGSMPAQSQTIAEEGVLLDNILLVDQGQFQEAELLELLTRSPYPARNPAQNIADLKAQIAANQKGVQELDRIVQVYGLATVQAYMSYVQANGEQSVRKMLRTLPEGAFSCALDTGEMIRVEISIDRKNHRAKIDFTGTTAQVLNNFNAPAAITKAVVLYVFRTLVQDDIPLNEGCLKPLEIILPEGSLLNPQYPAAVVAGNVETSQLVADCLYGALAILAASQGTMNNFTFGNQKYQYYETLCGGSGAGATFHGTDAIHTHMTNSKLTDPEVLELRFPVRLEQFAIRPNSGGSGRYRGGNGVIRRLRFLEPMTAGILSGRRCIPPFGLQGGEAGQPGRNWIERRDGSIQELAGNAMVTMEPGEVFVIETPGGGGYGTVNGEW